MQKKLYYKNRKGQLYLKYTRQEIIDNITYDFNTWLPWLAEMDYLASDYIYKLIYQHEKDLRLCFSKYLAQMNLMSFHDYGYVDSKSFNQNIKKSLLDF